MNIIKQIITLLFLFIFLSAHAHETLTLDGDNKDFKCGYRTGLFKVAKSPSSLKGLIPKLNLSVNCLAKDQKRAIRRSPHDVRGFTFGTHAAVSKVVSFEGGLELVVIVVDEETLMIGLVSYEGGGASLSLPMGVSITKGIIHGKCEGIEDYLGNFQTFSFIGLNRSYGTENEFTNPSRTYCDSSSLTLGASMSVVGYTMTHYQKGSNFYYVKGERVEDIIDYITKYHPLP